MVFHEINIILGWGEYLIVLLTFADCYNQLYTLMDINYGLLK